MQQRPGNPEALVSIALVLRQQTVPGKDEEAQFMVIAKDILGNPIDPARLRLDWTVSEPNAFKVDKNGLVTSIIPGTTAQVLVRDTVTGRVTTGTIRSLGEPTTGPNNAVGATPEPIPSGKPGVPVNPTTPSQGNNGPLQPPSSNPGTPSKAAQIMLTPPVTDLYPGERVQLNVSLLDDQGRAINPATVPLQWVSTEAFLPVDQNGVVTAQADRRTTRVTVSVPGTNLSATVVVNSLPARSGGGGGGGRDFPATTTQPANPATYSKPLSTTSFDVHILPPASTPEPIRYYEVTIPNAPGSVISFQVPFGTPFMAVPPELGLLPETTYPYSVVAVGNNNARSVVVSAFGTTLPTDTQAPIYYEPINLLGGSQFFNGVIVVPANTTTALNRTNGNALGAGDNTDAETLTVRLEPTAANFGKVTLTDGFPGTVTVSDRSTTGVFGNALVISGPKADVDEALNHFTYTPQSGFTGDATVTMSTSDTVDGANTPDDQDTLVFSVADPTASPPVNYMNSSTTFTNLTTAVNTPINLELLNNSELSLQDLNGDRLKVTLTPTGGGLSHINLSNIPAGVTPGGTGTNASPLTLEGYPFYIRQALEGGLTFTPGDDFLGTASVQMKTEEVNNPGNSDTDTLNIEVIQPSNFYGGSPTFPTTPVRMKKNDATTLEGSRALSVLYPPTSRVKVTLTLTDNSGGNIGQDINGTLTFDGSYSTYNVTEPATPAGADEGAAWEFEGLVTDINNFLAEGVMYSPNGSNTGFYKLRMDSVDVNNSELTDTNDILNLEVSEVPQNRFANNPNAFPPQNNPIELAHDTPLTFAAFFGTDLSVYDSDSPTITVTLTPSLNDGNPTGVLTRANTTPIPTGVTVTSGSTVLNPGSTAPITATNANPMVIVGSPANIRAFLNNGLVFTPTTGYQGLATVTMHSTDGGGEDQDITYINVLPEPENRRNDNADFSSFTPILWAPGQIANMSLGDRLLSVRNYASGNQNVEVTLSVPVGKGTLSLNGVVTATGTTGSVAYSGNGTNQLELRGTQANINALLDDLRYTADATAVAAPETVSITMQSSGGSLGDNDPGNPDRVPFLITNPPQNIYGTDDGDEAAENPTFPHFDTDGAGPLTDTSLQIFGDQTMVFNNTATSTQPAAQLGVADDSTTLSVTLTPANTLNNTGAQIALSGSAAGVNVSNGWDNSGIGTNAHPLVISGLPNDVDAALKLLTYTPEADFTGPTSFTMVANDGGPVLDTNTVDINIKPKPQNEWNTTTTSFAPPPGNAQGPSDPILMVNGVANLFADDGSGVNATIHEIGVRNLDAYNQPTDVATVRLQIPAGVLNVTLSGGVTITNGANGSGDLTLSATGSNIPNLNTVLHTLTWTPPTLADGVAPTTYTLTMTHGPIADSDTLNLRATRPPRNLYGGSQDFPTSRRQVTEGAPISFSGSDLVSVGSFVNETLEDSPRIRVTLTPSLVSGVNSGKVTVTESGAADASGAGTNADPLVIEGTPLDVNNTLASLQFAAESGVEGLAQINMVTTDFAARDNSGDAILLSLVALPANQVRVRSVSSNDYISAFSSVSSRTVPLNKDYAFDNHDDADNAKDRPQLRVNFYQSTDLITVTLQLSVANGTLSAPVPGGVGGENNGANGQPGTPLILKGTQSNINAALADLVYTSTNTAGNVTLTITSSGVPSGLSDTTGPDQIVLNVSNDRPTNNMTGTSSGNSSTSGFTNSSTTNPTMPLPLRVVSDTTTVEDRIDFGQGDTTAASATRFSVTGNTWPTLSVTDDDTTVTTVITPPNFGGGKSGILSDRSSTNFSGTGATVTGGDSSGSAMSLTGSPTQITNALARLRFVPDAGITAGTTASMTMVTTDGALQTDTDYIPILVDRPTIPNTYNSNPNPSGSVFRAIYQIGRDKLPSITVNDIVVSGDEINAGAQVQILRYNDTNPDTPGFESTTVLRTVTLKSPGTNETVSFDNRTNRATLTVNFSASDEPVISSAIPEGLGKIGGRLTTNGNVDVQVDTSVSPASHPYHYVTLPENAIYANEDNNTTGKYYFLNTGTPTTTGSGRLNLIFDSSGSADAQNGTNGTSLATAGLAKDPFTGYVYFIDFVSAGTTGQLIRWRPHFGIIDGASTGDPYTAMTTGDEIRVSKTLSGNTLRERFDGKPARLGFSSTINGATKKATLYAGSAFQKDDPTGNTLSGFYRIENYNGSGTISATEIPLIFQTKPFGLQRAYLNNGDIAFEPDTDTGSGVTDNHMFITSADSLFVSTAPVPETGDAAVTITEVDLSGVADDLRSNGDGTGQPVDGIVGLSIDGQWTTADPSLLLLVRYVGSASNVANLFRVHYNRATHALTTVELLENGDYSGKPMVDITSAHQPQEEP